MNTVTLSIDGAVVFSSAPTQPATVAALFAGMNDDEQAQFFEDVGRLIAQWEGTAGERQLWAVGRHMKMCACITSRGRDVLRTLVAAMDAP